MMKRVDNAVFSAFSDGTDMETGFMVMGLANGGVGYSLDEHNADLISASMRDAVDDASDKIAGGKLAVHNYMDDDNCPALDF